MDNRELKKMYEQSLHDKMLKYGHYLAVIIIVILPLFYLKDFYMTKYSQDTLVWRALPVFLAISFLFVKSTKLRLKLVVVKVSYIAFVYSILLMMLGIFYLNYGELEGRFNSFLIAGLITTMLLIHIFSAPIRKYIGLFTVSNILFLPFLFFMKGGDLFIFSNLLNPLLIISSIWIIAYNAEKNGYQEFKTKVLLEHRERTLNNEVEYRKEIEKGLKDKIVLDDMTGVFNRRAADTMIAESLEKHASFNQSCSLVFIDLDNLKLINDKLGHEAGDLLIKNFAHIASTELSKTDRIFRVGGDEFIILFTEKTLDEVKTTIKTIKASCLCRGIEFSYGLSTFSNLEPLDAETLIRNADMQMYTYKKKKKR